MMIAKDKSRWMLWPVRIKWSAASANCWFTTHGWQTGTERVPVEKTCDGCIPGFRRVFGWTFHLGRVKVCFGRDLPDRVPLAHTAFQSPRDAA